MMKLPRFLANQLAHPSGLLGKYIMGQLLNRMNSSHNSLVLNQLKVQRGDRVLEIGFGGADLLEKIVNQTSEIFVAGVELSDEMVENAKQRLHSWIATGCLDVQKGNIESLPYLDASFNKVCSVNTVYFWSNLAQSFAEIYRVIQPDGQLILGYIAPENVRSAGLENHGFLPYSTDELRTSLIKQGFIPGSLQSGSDKRGTYFVLTAKRAG
jgi:SAM-dependent methyltransferase